VTYPSIQACATGPAGAINPARPDSRAEAINPAGAGGRAGAISSARATRLDAYRRTG